MNTKAIQLEPIGGKDWWFNAPEQFRDRRIIGVFTSANTEGASVIYLVEADSEYEAQDILLAEGLNISGRVQGELEDTKIDVTCRVEALDHLKLMGVWCVSVSHTKNH